MKLETQNEIVLRRYLLDEMSDEERQKVEELFFQDDAIFDEMTALEDELHYDYQQNRLSLNERKAFEQKFLQSRQDIEKAAFANAFLETTAELANEKSIVSRKIVEESPVSLWQSIVAFFNFSGSMMQFGMAAAVLLLALGVIGLFIQNSRLQNEVAGLQNKQAQEKQEQEKILAEKQLQQTELEKQQTELEQQLANEKSNGEQNEKRIQEIEAQRTKLENEIAETRKRINQIPQNPVPQKSPISQPQSTLTTLILLPGLLNRENGQGMSKVNLSPTVKNLQLHLLLNNNKVEYKSYDAIVKSVDNQNVVWTNSNLKPQGKGARKNISLNIPTKNLQRADYEISIIGITATGEREELNNYYFSALK